MMSMFLLLLLCENGLYIGKKMIVLFLLLDDVFSVFVL